MLRKMISTDVHNVISHVPNLRTTRFAGQFLRGIIGVIKKYIVNFPIIFRY